MPHKQEFDNAQFIPHKQEYIEKPNGRSTKYCLKKPLTNPKIYMTIYDSKPKMITQIFIPILELKLPLDHVEEHNDANDNFDKLSYKYGHQLKICCSNKYGEGTHPYATQY